MKKRLASILLSLVMLLSLLPAAALAETEVAKIVDSNDAEIGRYETINAAFKALTSGQKIVLLADCTSNALINFGYPEQKPYDGQYAIDFAGYKITVNKGCGLDIHHNFNFYDSVGTGGMYGEATTVLSVEQNQSSPQVNIYGGTFHNGLGSLGAFDSWAAVNVASQGSGKITIFGGTFDGFRTGTPNVFIKGGTFNKCFLTEEGGLTISGGTFNVPFVRADGFNPYVEGVDPECTVTITGGTFAEDPTEFVVDGYKATQNDDNTWTVDAKPGFFKAQIGKTKYQTLDAAISAATDVTATRTSFDDGVTIKLLDNIEVINGHALTGYGAVQLGKAYGGNYLTIDGDGHTIKLMGTSVTEELYNERNEVKKWDKYKYYAISVSNGIVKLKNLTVDSNANSFGNDSINKTKLGSAINCINSTVELDNVTVKNTNGGWSAVNVNKSTVTLTGCTAKENVLQVISCDGGTVDAPSVATIESGTYDGTVRTEGANAYNKLYIEDGKFSFNTVNESLTLDKAKGSIFEISGGIFGVEPAANLLAEGYEVVDNDNDETKATYPKKLVEKQVAKIGDEIYNTLAAAIAAVPANSETATTITMIGDENCEFSGKYGVVIPSTKKIVLDLNGHTLSGHGTNNDHSYYIYNLGALTIKNSGTTGCLTFTAAHPDSSYGYGTSTVLNRGVLTLSSGTIENTTSGGASYAVDNQTLWFDDLVPVVFNMNGGTVKCTTGDASIRQSAGLGEKYKLNDQIVDNIISITAGTVTGDIWIQSAAVENVGSHSTLNISGGTITGKVYDTLNGDGSHLVYSFTGGSIGEVDMSRAGKGSFKTGFISGGVYGKEVPEAYIATDYVCIANTDAATKENYPFKVAHETTVTDVTATVSYGDAVSNGVIKGKADVPGSFAWEDVTSYGDATNDTPRTLDAVFTPARADYASADVKVSVTVLKASQSAPAKGEGYTIEGTTLKAASGYEILISGTNAPTENNPTTAQITITAGQNYFVRRAGNNNYFASPYTAIDTTVSINVLASPANMGTVTGGGTYTIGASVSVTATAGSGYKFVKWMDKDTQASTDAAYTFTATAGRTLIAVFEPADKTVVQIPVAENKTYTGAELTGVTATTNCSVTGNTGTNARTYTATATLTNTTDYVWADGTTAPKTITWVIYKAPQTAPTVAVEENVIKVTSVEGKTAEYMAKGGTEYGSIPAEAVAAGTYYVRFAGDDNHNPSPAVVVVVSKPTITVTTIQPEVTGKNTATLHGIVTPYDADRVTEVGFRYSANGTSWTNVSDSIAPAASFSADISGLTAGTKYIAQAYVVADSTPIYGAQTTFYTLADEATGEIDILIDNPQNKAVTITVEEGNNVLASVALNGANWTINHLEDGFYNIVVRTTDGDFTETRLVEVVDGNAVASSFSIPTGKIATVVEVKSEDTPPVAVGGLSEILTTEDKNAAATGSVDVEIKLEAQKEESTASESAQADTTQYAVAQIKKLIPEATATVEEKIETVLDLSLIKTTTELENNEVKSVEVKDIGSENDKVIEVAVPYETDGKTLKVYRYHDGVAEELTLLSSRPSANFIDGTYFVGDGYVFIYASGFSTYAISYEETKTVTGGGGVTTYAITGADTKNGKLTVDKKTASSGSTVTITVTPDKGFTLETLTVLDKNGKEVEVKNLGNNKYSFKMPSGKVTVKATFMEDNTMLNFFVDVKATDYFYDAVLWAAENDITKGTDAVHFSPSMGTTRAQAVTFLWRAAGCPEPKGDASKFADVKADSYYEKAVAWAVEQGITTGVTAAEFKPDDICKRGQIVSFLYRYAKGKAVGVNPFNDVKADAYYYDAVLWAVENGVTGGTTATTFSPANTCTRAQVVTFLWRYMGD